MVLLAFGTCTLVLALPLWGRKVAPNRTFGFRTPLTVSNPRVWYATNEVAGRDLAAAGASMVALGALGPPGLLALGAGALSLCVAALHTLWWASAYVADERSSGSEGIALASLRPKSTRTAPLRKH